AFQIGAGQVGVGEVVALEGGAGKVCTGKVRAAKDGSGESRPAQVGARQVGAGEVASVEGGACEVATRAMDGLSREERIAILRCTGCPGPASRYCGHQQGGAAPIHDLLPTRSTNILATPGRSLIGVDQLGGTVTCSVIPGCHCEVASLQSISLGQRLWIPGSPFCGALE